MVASGSRFEFLEVGLCGQKKRLKAQSGGGRGEGVWEAGRVCVPEVESGGDLETRTKEK